MLVTNLLAPTKEMLELEDDNRRRVRAYRLNVSYIGVLLRGEFFRFKGLPNDVNIVRFDFYAPADEVRVILQSSSFDYVSPHMELPIELLWIEAGSALIDQKNQAYAERNKLVCALSKLLPSHLKRHPDDQPWEDDWRWIVCVHGPTGQMTWHIHDSELPNFIHLEAPEHQGYKYGPIIPLWALIGPAACQYDGHSTEEKYERLERMKNAKE